MAHAVAQDEVEDHGWDPDDQAGGGGDERLADVAGEEFGAPHSSLADRLEGADHAADRPEQSDHRGNSRDDVQVVDPLRDAVLLGFEVLDEEGFHLMLVEVGAVAAKLEEGGGKTAPEHRVAGGEGL